MRGLVLALIIAALLPVSAARAVGQTNLGCGAGKLVLNVRYSVANDIDTGLRGNNWAFDSYVRTVRVWRKSLGRFCAASTYDGTFMSIAGASPGGGATIPAGIRGTFKGSSVVTFRGVMRFGVSRQRVDLGAKDFSCTSDAKKGQCTGTYDWLKASFMSADNFRSFKYARYTFTYHATDGGKGTFSDSLVAGKVRTHGDITARGKKK
jgi:hypothetical protein